MQSEIARLLLEHGFLMQAFTVLRELIGSIGLLGLSGTKYMSRQIDHRERASTRRYADVFVNMLQHPNWDFKGDTKEQAERLKPFFDHVVALDRTLYGTEDDFREAVRRLVDIRNGFDHAWTTTKPGARPYPDGITAFKGHGEAMRKRLLALVERLFDDDGSVVVVNPPPDADA